MVAGGGLSDNRQGALLSSSVLLGALDEWLGCLRRVRALAIPPKGGCEREIGLGHGHSEVDVHVHVDAVA